MGYEPHAVNLEDWQEVAKAHFKKLTSVPGLQIKECECFIPARGHGGFHLLYMHFFIDSLTDQVKARCHAVREKRYLLGEVVLRNRCNDPELRICRAPHVTTPIC